MSQIPPELVELHAKEMKAAAEFERLYQRFSRTFNAMHTIHKRLKRLHRVIMAMNDGLQESPGDRRRPPSKKGGS